MNHVTSIRLRSEPNGALTIENDDGTITVHPDGTVAISTVAPIQLTGDSLGKMDGPCNTVADLFAALRTRGIKKG